ncbi:MAG: hypothetical protein K1X71_17270 [Pirellulales bacterium]|jgi:hypothetical protein|nr:hypothetical protein [Pirellulales bacterium]
MMEDHYLPFEDRCVDLMEAQLAADVAELAIDDLIAISHFIDRIGGLENALMAMQTLRDIERAA